MGRRPVKQACTNCRQRHLRCDLELPPCSRCKASKLKCDKPSRQEFRFMRFDEADRRVRCREDVTSTPLRERTNEPTSTDIFVNETSLVIETYRRHEDDEQRDIDSGRDEAFPHANNTQVSHTDGSLDAFAQLQDLSPSKTAAFDNPPSIIGLPLAASVQHVSSHSGPDSTQATNLTGTPSFTTAAANISVPVNDHLLHNSRLETLQNGLSDSSRTSNPSSLYLNWSPSTNFLPTVRPREAYLVKLFTQTWAPIFDCLDADATFTKVVARIALTTSQPLLWSVLATSALQLSRVSDYPFAAAQYYRSRCSEAIMPILLTTANPEVREDTLFATYVMLRNYEHMTEKITTKDPENLFTAALAISVNPSEQMSHQADIGRAAFWVHMRQDIHIALLLRVPISTDYPICVQRDKILFALDRITSQQVAVRYETLDCAWANTLASLLVEIINYCFQEGFRNIQDWIALRGRLDHWTLAKPSSFKPYCERDREPSQGRAFPEFWLWSDCHVIAWLYFHTAAILLKAYVPANERFDIGVPAMMQLADKQEILLHARAICGIVATNPNAQALIMLCHMATISAIFFTNEAEQKETIKLLEMAHSVTGHPCEEIKQKLFAYWRSTCGSKSAEASLTGTEF